MGRAADVVFAVKSCLLSVLYIDAPVSSCINAAAAAATDG